MTTIQLMTTAGTMTYERLDDERLWVAGWLITYGSAWGKRLGNELLYADPCAVDKCRSLFGTLWAKIVSFKDDDISTQGAQK